MAIYPVTPVPDGSTAKEIRPYDVLVYQEGGHYYAKDRKGNLICVDSPTACLQDAINYVVNLGGGRVFIKNGTYNINSSINMPNGDLNLTVEGESTSTVLQVNDDINVFNFYVNQNNVAIKYVNIENLSILGNINNHIGTAFNFDVYTGDNKLRYIALITIRNVVVHRVNQGIYARDLWLARFENLEIQYSGVSDPIIYLDQYPNVNSTHDIYFDKLYIEDVNTIPVYGVDNVYNINIYNCYIDAWNKATYDIYFTNYSSRNRIYGCYLAGATQYTIRTGVQNIVENNYILDTQGGIEVGWDEGVVLSNVISASSSSYGIRVDGRPYARIIGNEIINAMEGIYLDWQSNYTEIIGNIIINTAQNGIDIYHTDYVVIKGNAIINPSTSSMSYNGIYINEEGNQIIVDNLIQGSNMKYSIAENLANNDIIMDNIVSAPIKATGANTIVRRNVGYATVASGQVSIAAGSTSVTVSHGLVCTPTKVLVTPLAQPSGSIWVSNITSTQFTVNISSAPSSNLPIAWYAEC
jgi:hypothetical protein